MICQVPAALAAVLVATAAAAGEVRVIAGGAVKSPVAEVAGAFERQTGHTVSLTFLTAGEIAKKLAAGDTADVLIVPAENIDGFEAQGKIVPGTRTPLGKVGIGVAVNERAPSPDISSAAAFRQTLLDAKSIVYVDPERGTSGRHFAGVLVQLGIAEQMKPKTTLGPGGYVVEPVGRGEIELGVHQISEILPVKGVKLVGPLPAPLQKWTTYTAVLMPPGDASPAAREFIRFAAMPASRESFTTRGFVLPD